MSTDSWDDETITTRGGLFEHADEPVPGAFDESSLELDLELMLEDSREIERRTATGLIPPTSPMHHVGDASDLVVFEPMPIGLAEALGRLGYSVRAATSGVDAMSLVAERPPSVLVCGPASDAERRRLLAAALRLRFPTVPIVYVSSHAGRDDAVAGALREGAKALLAWPLPAPDEVDRVLGRSSSSGETAAWPKPVTLVSAARSPASVDVPFDEAQTMVLAPKPALRERVSLPDDQPGRPPGAPPARGPGQDWRDPTDPIRPGDMPRTSSTEQRRRGEVAALLDAISPFLWGLEDAARFVEEQAQSGDPRALSHVKTLRLLAKLLGQLQKRIDETGA